MANIVELRRVVHIQGKTTGVKEATGDLKQLDRAMDGVTVSAEKTTRATLSEERALRALQTRLDPTFRATERLAAAERTLTAAQAQGLITLARKNQLMALATAETNQATVATSRLAAAQRGLSGLAGMAGLGGGAAVTGILAAGFAVSAFIKNSVEAQASLAQLNAVIASTGGAAGMTAGELTALAMELQRTTTFGDDAVVASEALLLTFTKIGRETFPDAIRAIADMSTAMGTDLKSSTIQVGKALNDPIKGITALTRVGVTFTESQKDMIKSLVEGGKSAEAQRLILKELQTEFGGSAAAARDTLGGALKALQNSFGDLFEVSGEGSANLVRSINDITDALSDPATIQSVQDFGAALFDGFSDAIDAAQTFLDQANAVIGFFDRIQQEAKELRESLGLEQAMGGASILGGAITFGSPQIVDETAAGFAKLQASAKAAADAVTEVAPPINKVASEFKNVEEAADDAAKAIKNPIDLVPLMGGGVDKLEDKFKSLKATVVDFGVSMATSFIDGELTAQKMADSLDNLRDQLAEGAVRDLIAGNWVMAAIKGIGAVVAHIFGNRAQERAEEQARREEARLKREEKLQDRKEELARKEDRRQSLREGRAGYADRAYFAGLDTSTLEGQLAQFDREAERERQAVKDSISNAAKRNKQLAALEEALAAERLAIMQDFAAQAAADAQAAAAQALADAQAAAAELVASAQDDLRRAYEAEAETRRETISGIQTTISGLKQFTSSIRALRDSLRIDSGLSPLNPAARLAEARRQFETATPDTLAAAAQNYLTEAKDFFASSPDYASIFDQVQASLDQQLAGAEAELSTAERQLSVAEKQLTALEATVNAQLGTTQAVMSVAAAIHALHAALATQAGIGMASGGIVGNGTYNVDSVVARYAGGGTIGLAGGEYVMPAAQTRAHLPQLEAMRSGGGANDNGRILAVGFGDLSRQLSALVEGQQRNTMELKRLQVAVDRPERPKRKAA